MPLEIYTDAPIKSFVQLKRAEPKVKDSSMLVVAKFCPRKYFYRFVLGYAPKGNNESPWFPWGTAYHKFRELFEVYYKKYLGEEKNIKESVIQAAADASIEAITLYDRTRIKSVLPKYEKMYTLARFIEAIKVVIPVLMKEKEIGSIEVLETEQPFMVQLPDGSYTGGRFDQIIKWNRRVWGRDFKTTSKKKEYYSATLDPNDQFTRYTVAESLLTGEKIAGQLVSVLHNDGAKILEVVDYPVEKTQQQLETWIREQIFWNKIMDIWRAEDMYVMADNYSHCSFCEYRKVCSSVSEGAMISELKRSFHVNFWDYTTVRD